jgi:hypothetical protein
MFFGALLTLSAMRNSGGEGEEGAEGDGGGGSPKARRSSFSQRMEDRFRKRFEDGP